MTERRSFLCWLLGHRWNVIGTQTAEHPAHFPTESTALVKRCERCCRLGFQILPGRWVYNKKELIDGNCTADDLKRLFEQ